MSDQMEVRKALASHELSEEDVSKFVAAIDLQRSRSGGIMPLASHEPLRRSSVDDKCRAGVPAADLALPTILSCDQLLADMAEEKMTPASGRIDRWQKKLLDLTLRNRLLNFPDKKTPFRSCAQTWRSWKIDWPQAPLSA